MQREFVTHDDGHNGGYPHHHDVVWTEEQLAKYRIRKADEDEQPPWVAKRFDRDKQAFGGAALYPLGRPPRWWVYQPGDTEVSACWSSHQAAVEHVSGLICHQIVAPYRKDDE